MASEYYKVTFCVLRLLHRIYSYTNAISLLLQVSAHACGLHWRRRFRIVDDDSTVHTPPWLFCLRTQNKRIPLLDSELLKSFINFIRISVYLTHKWLGDSDYAQRTSHAQLHNAIIISKKKTKMYNKEFLRNGLSHLEIDNGNHYHIISIFAARGLICLPDA